MDVFQSARLEPGTQKGVSCNYNEGLKKLTGSINAAKKLESKKQKQDEGYVSMPRTSLTDSAAASKRPPNRYHWVQMGSRCHPQLFRSTTQHPHHPVYRPYRPLSTLKDHLHLEHQGEEGEGRPEVDWGVEEGSSIILVKDLMMERAVLVGHLKGGRQGIEQEVRRREEEGDLKSQRDIGARPTFSVFVRHLR